MPFDLVGVLGLWGAGGGTGGTGLEEIGFVRQEGGVGGRVETAVLVVQEGIGVELGSCHFSIMLGFK